MTVQEWVSDILWKPWGWAHWRADNAETAYATSQEKDRIQSAVEFVIRSLANDNSLRTQQVLDTINERREAKRKRGGK